MHVSSINIKNFRNFRNFSISFNEEFQTIIGENNIGKSNLYYAIRLVLDSNLSYNARKLAETDFNKFPKINEDSNIIISIEFSGEDLEQSPILGAMRVAIDKARITYVFAHNSRLRGETSSSGSVSISDFSYRLYAGGDSLDFEELIKLYPINFEHLKGINIFYIAAFRNIYKDIEGTNYSLLNRYCASRPAAEDEMDEVRQLLSEPSAKINSLEFINNISSEIESQGNEISGKYFSSNLEVNFSSDVSNDFLNALQLYFKDGEVKIPISLMGLGQKNLLYLSIYLSKLQNERLEGGLDILLIEEPEAHLHPQLQKILFSRISAKKSLQVFMSSHSTHIASTCEYKSLNVIYRARRGIKSFSPFIISALNERDKNLLKRYLDATRSELFFSSGVILVEGVAEQFLIPEIAKKIFQIDLVENNISVVPVYGRYFDPYLKLFQKGNFEIPACVIIDGDKYTEYPEEISTAVKNAKTYEIPDRVMVFHGEDTLESDLFPNKTTNNTYLQRCFTQLGHIQSYNNLLKTPAKQWNSELMSRIAGVVTKGRFAQELAQQIDDSFKVPDYIQSALSFLFKSKGLC